MSLIQRLNDAIEENPNVTSDDRINLYKLLTASNAGNSAGGADAGNGTSGSGTGGGGGAGDNDDPLRRSTNVHRSTGEIVALCVAYAAVFAVSLFGNLLVCHVIVRHRRLHTVTNTFIANLAVSDVFITVVNLPFNVARHVTDDWPFGEFMCALVNFTLTVFVYVSTFTMTAIAVDRYLVIVHPFRPRMSVRMGVGVVGVTWLLGAVMSLPFAIFARVGC